MEDFQLQAQETATEEEKQIGQQEEVILIPSYIYIGNDKTNKTDKKL